jgi:DNA-binding MarR family transcriptional regulator
MKIDNFIQKGPLFWLFELKKFWAETFGKHLKKEDVNFKEALILMALLFEGKKKVTPSQLVNSLSEKKSVISQSLTKLETMGLLKREIGITDARFISLELTREGMIKANRLIKMFEEFENFLEEALIDHPTTNLPINFDFRELLFHLNRIKKMQISTFN